MGSVDELIDAKDSAIDACGALVAWAEGRRDLNDLETVVETCRAAVKQDEDRLERDDWELDAEALECSECGNSPDFFFENQSNPRTFETGDYCQDETCGGKYATRT